MMYKFYRSRGLLLFGHVVQPRRAMQRGWGKMDNREAFCVSWTWPSFNKAGNVIECRLQIALPMEALCQV
jgi:hypothetical protein